MPARSGASAASCSGGGNSGAVPWQIGERTRAAGLAIAGLCRSPFLVGPLAPPSRAAVAGRVPALDRPGGGTWLAEHHDLRRRRRARARAACRTASKHRRRDAGGGGRPRRAGWRAARRRAAAPGLWRQPLLHCHDARRARPMRRGRTIRPCRWPSTSTTSGGTPRCRPNSSAPAPTGSPASTCATGWRTRSDVLLDRGMMGDGVADLKALRQAVENAGYAGFCEVEVFSAARLVEAPAGRGPRCLRRTIPDPLLMGQQLRQRTRASPLNRPASPASRGALQDGD